MQLERDRVSVWDPFVRMFHWSLVLACLVVWLSAEEWEWLHEQTGYFILVLIGMRMLWGVLGTRHARFREFLHGPTQTLAYLNALRAGTPPRYLGHNPAGGWMVIALMSSLSATAASGMFIGAEHAELWEDLHEGFADLTLLLVFVHLGGVLFSSLLHKENLIAAMLTGMKKRRNADV